MGTQITEPIHTLSKASKRHTIQENQTNSCSSLQKVKGMMNHESHRRHLLINFILKKKKS